MDENGVFRFFVYFINNIMFIIIFKNCGIYSIKKDKNIITRFEFFNSVSKESVKI